jgi:uncharacterized tellurite resistance protein B-like protein
MLVSLSLSGCSPKALLCILMPADQAISDADVDVADRPRGLSMATIDLENVLKIFGGNKPTPEERKELVKEVLLMTLARASSSDSNINPCEVGTVQRMLKAAIGENISATDIRVAAASEIFERAPLEKYLAGVASSLTPEDKATVARSLAEVIRADVAVTSRETAFFDKVAQALKISPAELAGLVA